MESPQIKNSPPELFIFPGGDWEEHQENLYNIFKDTLIKRQNYFQKNRVGVKRVPEYKNKHSAFWHLTSEGEKEEERTPDFRRCERLSWISWVIENSSTCMDISWWENTRKGEKNIVIWYEKGEESYAVILSKREGYFLLKTAYPVADHRARSFIEERKSYHSKDRKPPF